MGKQWITLFRVPHSDTLYGYVYAMVTDHATLGLKRLKSDDPIWRRHDVEIVWQHQVSENSRLKVRDRNIIFKANGRLVRDHVRAERQAA